LDEALTYWCDDQRHLVCTPYSLENLHRMAEDLGIGRHWFHGNASYAHYDVPKRRQAEVTARCNLVDPRTILKIVKGKYP
jgi:hypothetical protein